MMMNSHDVNSPHKTPAPAFAIISAWAVVLLVSDLPDAVSQALTGSIPGWLFAAKLGLLLTAIAASLISRRLRALRPFFFLLLILAAGRKALTYYGLTPAYITQGQPDGFLLRLAQFEGARLLLAAVMLAALFVMGKRRKELFLVKGDLRKWKWPGLILAFSIMILTFVFFDYDLPSTALVRVLPLLPAALLFAALAAFDEELRSRAALLPDLSMAVGKVHTIALTAFYFGMGHYFGGVPSGMAGFLVAGSLGWLYATMMLETRGIFMPWLNHFLTNVPTFLSWAIGSLAE